VLAVIAATSVAACSSPSPTVNDESNGKQTTVPAALWPKSEVVDNVPLVPITSAQRAKCERFADQLKRQVPCPGLLPDPIAVSARSSAASCLGELGEDSCGPAVINDSGGIFLLNQSNFQVPPGYIGVTFEQYSGKVVPEASLSGGPLGHFVFMTGTDLQLYLRDKSGRDVPPVPTYCSSIQDSGVLRVHGSLATLYQCSDSSSTPGQLEIIMGHDVLAWNDSGITCEVSFHGHTQVNIALDIAVADATELVSPTNR
jgi:hypothetical protein